MGDQHNQANQPTPAGGQPGGPQPGYQGQQPMPNTPVNDPGKMQPVTPQTPPPGTPGAPPSPPMVSFPSPGMAPHYGGQMPQQPMATPGGVQPPQVGAPQDIVAYWKEQYRAEKDRADDLAGSYNISGLKANNTERDENAHGVNLSKLAANATRRSTIATRRSTIATRRYASEIRHCAISMT